MKLGICDTFSEQYPKFAWIEQEAKALNWETGRIRTVYGLANHEQDFDVVLFSQRPPVDWDELRELSKGRRAAWVTWVFDYLSAEFPLLGSVPWDAYDAVFSKMPDSVPLNGRSFYLDQASPPWGKPGNGNRMYEMLFPGRFTPRRFAICRQWVDRGYRLAIAGPGWKVEGGKIEFPGGKADHLGHVKTDHEMRVMFSSALVTLGDNHSNSLPGYWSDRQWLAMAGGSVFCGPHVLGMKRVLMDDNFDPNVPGRCRDPGWVNRNRRWQESLVAKNRYRHRLLEIESRLKAIGLIKEN